MQFRSKNNSLLNAADPWVVSSAFHAVLAFAVFVVLFLSQHRKPVDVEIQIIESPRLAGKPVDVTPAAPVRRKQAAAHEVFGISPKAVTSGHQEAEEVKAGNTVAKAPDQETLKPGDPDALPVPSDEYLVTNMPEMKSEVRVPYPAEARRRGIKGAVIMNLLIDDTGRVREVSLIEGPNAELNAAAMTAARGFQFTPAMIKNKPVAVRIRYVYRFVLEH